MAKFFFILVLFFSVNAQGAAQRDREAGQAYPFVGYGHLHAAPHCTYTVVRHGLLVTAKHCFSRRPSVNIQSLKVSLANGVQIPGTAMRQLILDEGENDLAWVLYDLSATQEKLALPPIALAEALPADEASFDMPGSPASLQPRPFSGVVGCSLTGKEGYFPPLPKDPGYEGRLVEMDCPAWYGQSGSPVIERKGESFILYGVLSHTFDVLADGSLDPAKIERDSLGPFVRRSMFSPIFFRRYQPAAEANTSRH